MLRRQLQALRDWIHEGPEGKCCTLLQIKTMKTIFICSCNGDHRCPRPLAGLAFLRFSSNSLGAFCLSPFAKRSSNKEQKVLHGAEREREGGRREECESKGEEMEFTVQTSGEFQCPPGHRAALFGPRRLRGEKSSSHSRVRLF